MYLYHYYDKSIGPFRNLSDLSKDEANAVMEEMKRTKPGAFCTKRSEEYMQLRHYYEDILRESFIKKGGVIKREHPHYMVLGESSWLSTWYENSAVVAIPIAEFDLDTVSFTYGDSHPTFSNRVNDGKEYRKQLYTYSEILKVIAKYGYPQEWNADGKFGPERYIEAHIWNEEPIKKYR